MIPGPRSPDAEPRPEQPASTPAPHITTINRPARMRIAFSPARSGGYGTRFTAGGFQVPSRIEGFGVSFGQYSRSIRTNFPVGAGSQFASLSRAG